MRQTYALILSCLLWSLVSCEDSTLYDFDEQLSLDVALIEEYLESHNISHQTDPTGISYEVLTTTPAEGIGANEYGLFEVTIWFLSGDFFGSTNPDIDRANGGDGQFRVRAAYSGRDVHYYDDSKYLSVIGPKMKLGDQYRLYVPSGFGFGFEPPGWIRNHETVAPNTNLIIEITLSEIRN